MGVITTYFPMQKNKQTRNSGRTLARPSFPRTKICMCLNLVVNFLDYIPNWFCLIKQILCEHILKERRNGKMKSMFLCAEIEIPQIAN